MRLANWQNAQARGLAWQAATGVGAAIALVALRPVLALTEPDEQEEEAFEHFEKATAAIRTIPAHTSKGLAVKARAVIPAVWSNGDYKKGAALGADENWDKAGIRDLIEASCKLARVDWRGNAVAVGADAVDVARSPAGNADIVADLRRDLPTYSVQELRALNEVANLLAEICGALSFQPRGLLDDGRSSADRVVQAPASKLVHAVAEMCDRLIEVTRDEATVRSPECHDDRETRLALIAAPVIENGDPDEIGQLALDIAGLV